MFKSEDHSITVLMGDHL